MKVCKKCGAKYFGGEVFCSLDGEPLFDPRLGELAQTIRKQQEGQTDGDSFVGRRIEKYDIIRRIGEGGMGEVYEARHVHIGKRVALKVLREDFSRKEDVVERFRQEARSASIIGHDNIIDITDFGTTPDGRFFFVMEYLEGRDLATVFETQRTIPYERALRIVKQVCMGLMAAHEKGIVHRDLKPENIFLVNEGSSREAVKILDFGIAKMSVIGEEGRKLTKTGVVFGTPEYMSPEQAAGKPVDERIDVYSLGVIMYEMFTGTVPFTGDTFMSILTKHMFEPVPPLKLMNPNLSVPVAMEHLVLRMLEKEPDKRIGSMAELLAALRKVEADPATVEFAPVTGPRRDPSMATPGPVLEVVGDVEERKGGGLGRIVAIVVALVLVAAGLGTAAFFLAPGVVGGMLGDRSREVASAGAGGGKDAGAAVDQGSAGPGARDASAAADAAPATLEPPAATLRVETDEADTIVTVEGRGQMCVSTPCEVPVVLDETVALVLEHGKVRRSESVLVAADPTLVTFSMKAPHKPGKGKAPVGVEAGPEPGPEPVGDEGGPGKGSVDVGDLKIPSVYKKDKSN